MSFVPPPLPPPPPPKRSNLPHTLAIIVAIIGARELGVITWANDLLQRRFAISEQVAASIVVAVIVTIAVIATAVVLAWWRGRSAD